MTALTTSRFVRRGGAALATLVLLGACPRPPKLTPLQGVAPAEARLPALELPAGRRRVVFKWEMDNQGMLARGEGVARVAPPDSARVDLFLGGGFGAASVILLGDRTATPPGAGMTDLIPAAPLLWATLGRLAIPALPDTIVRVAGDTLRATVGRPVAWRITAIGGILRRVERVAGDRIVEFVDRTADGKKTHYELASQRSLQLIVGDEQPAAFDASIWRY